MKKIFSGEIWKVVLDWIASGFVLLLSLIPKEAYPLVERALEALVVVRYGASLAFRFVTCVVVMLIIALLCVVYLVLPGLL